ncbi:MAG: hypothetical protein M1305_05375 [Candidatus Marsarchaeota archaeon]|nr:hypothetical protein [Candidatus Marsarchaeota archaeon]
MDRIQRLTMLREMVQEAGGRIVGRKKLHKLAYICQRAGTDLGQSFTFHLYGMYSPSLADDLRMGEAWGVLVEDDVPGEGYVITQGDGELRPDTTELQGDPHGFSLVRQLASQPPIVLEVLTTILYLYDAGYRGEQIRKKLHELKGHLSGSFGKAYELADHCFEIRLDDHSQTA